MDREAVEKVMGKHLVLGLDRREVECTVPARKLIEKYTQTRPIFGRESDAQRCGIAQQALE
jgi:hypothetical protein